MNLRTRSRLQLGWNPGNWQKYVLQWKSSELSVNCFLSHPKYPPPFTIHYTQPFSTALGETFMPLFNNNLLIIVFSCTTDFLDNIVIKRIIQAKFVKLMQSTKLWSIALDRKFPYWDNTLPLPSPQNVQWPFVGQFERRKGHFLE